MLRVTHIFLVPVICVASGLLVPLVGCGGHSITQSIDLGVRLQGKVQGGQQPIAGAHVYLLAANTIGYGKASVSLLDASVTGSSDSLGAYVLTGSDGTFNIPENYSCTPDSQVYLLALGGNPGAGSNPATGLLAALGNCPASGSFLGSTPSIAVNEVSTVAAAYAMSGFAVDATHVSSSGTPAARTGIANAFASARNLVSLSTGRALDTTPAGDGMVLQSLTNTLADILASCVNSTGSTPNFPGPSTCSQLFQSATSDGTSTGTVPAETATATINIAHHPGSNVAALFALGSSRAPYAPALSSSPNDYAERITYRAQLESPKGIAVDSSGNIWLANYADNNLVELSTVGAILSPAGGFTGGGVYRPSGIAIDTLDNIWIGNGNKATVSKFDNAGAPLSPSTGFTGGGLVGSGLAVAIDSQNNAWIVNGGARAVITKLASDGTPLSPAKGFTGGGLSGPKCIAIDPSGNAWIGNPNKSISELSPDGLPLSLSTGDQGGGLDGGYSIAIDHAADIWVGDAYNGSAAKFTNSGLPISPATGFTGGGLSEPLGVAIDGDGNAWFASGHLSELSSSGVALSPANGYSAVSPQSVAIDGSGNVWLAATDDFSAVEEFVGLGAPVVTPLAVGLRDNTLATRP